MKRVIYLLVLFFFLFFCRGNVKAAQIECSGWPGTGDLGQPCCYLEDNPGLFFGKYLSGKCNGGLRCNIEPGRSDLHEGYCYEAENVCGEVSGSPCCGLALTGSATATCKNPELECNKSSGECELKTEKCHCGKPDLTGNCVEDPNGPKCGLGPREPFCRYDIRGICGEDSLKANCECATQEEARKDPELNGTYKIVGQISNIKKDRLCDVNTKTAPKDRTIKIHTALGCIPINVIELVGWIFERGFGIVGGIAFILLIGAFIQLATSEGDVKKIQGAKELITSTVTGLLLSIFSIFIIRLLMITILRIPGLK